MLYGNSSEGYSYSPDRRNDYVDRYNRATRDNYPIGYNPTGCGVYTPDHGIIDSQTWRSIQGSSHKTTGGWYDGRGQYHDY